MKRYQFVFGLLLAGMFFANALPAKAPLASTIDVLEQGETPTITETLVLKAASEETQISYEELLSGFLRGTVSIEDLGDDHYLVVYGEASGDFIILHLEED